MKKALGRGLSALIPDTYANQLKVKEVPKASGETVEKKPENFETAGIRMMPVSMLLPNLDQPRKNFSAEGIDELAASIKEKGILQPIIVKKTDDNRYMIICGERRFRASMLCGLEEVPVVIKDVAQEDLLEWALIENVQREDLSPLEEAEAYCRLAEERMLTQDEIAKRVGKDRSTVANMMRLVRLPLEVQNFMKTGQLSSGHARAILGLLTPEHQRQLAKRIVEENLSVRQVETIVNRSNAHKRKGKTARNLGPEIIDLESRLSQHFGTQVKIFPKKNQKQGRIEIRYFSLDDLDRILQKTALPCAG